MSLALALMGLFDDGGPVNLPPGAPESGTVVAFPPPSPPAGSAGPENPPPSPPVLGFTVVEAEPPSGSP